jgi:hypothetical protein
VSAAASHVVIIGDELTDLAAGIAAAMACFCTAAWAREATADTDEGSVCGRNRA